MPVDTTLVATAATTLDATTTAHGAARAAATSATTTATIAAVATVASAALRAAIWPIGGPALLRTASRRVVQSTINLTRPRYASAPFACAYLPSLAVLTRP